MAKVNYALLSVVGMFFPSIALAETQNASELIKLIAGYFNTILLLLMGLAVVLFVWYVVKYYIRENDDRTAAAQYILWSLTGFFVILSMWGLVNILVKTFNLGGNGPGSRVSVENFFPTGGGKARHLV